MSRYVNEFPYFRLPSLPFPYFPPYLISLPSSPLCVLDSWRSNKSFSPAEGARSTLTWSLWPRNTSSFLLHMVGSLTELLHISPARSAPYLLARLLCPLHTSRCPVWDKPARIWQRACTQQRRAFSIHRGQLSVSVICDQREDSDFLQPLGVSQSKR